MLPIEIRDRSFPLTRAFFSLMGGSVLLLLGCVSKQIRYEIPPSHHALTDISQLHVDQFEGQNALLFKDILIQEIYKIPNFDYHEEFPDGGRSAAVISGEVLVYSARDEKELRDKTQVTLIQRDVMKRPKRASERIRQRVFDFAEVPFQERAIHRTLDLDIRFTVTAAASGKVLYRNTEKHSFQQSYIGEETILLMPLVNDEMERLGRQLIHRFLDKLNPSLSSKTLQLEIGTSPLPFTLGMTDLGHPRILAGNRHAVAQDYEKAIKIWNYVVFAPQGFEQEEEFIFSDEVYAQLKSAKLPPRIIQSLLALRNETWSLRELDKKLPKLIGVRNFRNYHVIIKSHARSSISQDKLNLAAAHYNLGSVYRLQNKLELAAYHFAQANAFSPREKYAQAWTDVQHELGDFNPLDTLVERTIEAASQRLAPSAALTRVEKVLAGVEEDDQTREGYPPIEPVELPILLEENQETTPAPPAKSGAGLDLD